MKYLFIGVFYLLMFFGVLDFYLWSQVVDMWNSEGHIDELVMHPHGMRYLLVLPIFIVSNWLNISYDLTFMMVVPFLFLFLVSCILNIITFYRKSISIHDERILFLLLSFVIIVLSYFMNGRIIFALLGFSVIYFVLVYWERLKLKKVLLFFVFGLMLMSVSSGTFLVGVISISVFILYKVINRRTRKNLFLFLLLLIALFATFPLLELLIMRNIDYFGGVFLMLEHGVGRSLLIVSAEILWMLASIVIIFILMLLMFFYSYNQYSILGYLIFVSVPIGMFGESTFAMSLVPLLVCFGLFWLSVLQKISVQSKPILSVK